MIRIFALDEVTTGDVVNAANETTNAWSISNILEMLKTWTLNVGVKLIVALLVMFISFKIVNFVSRKIEKKNNKSQKIDKTLVRTLLYVGKIVIKCIIAVCLITYVGIDTSSITALIASLGVCVGLAVNGTLSNLAGGILLLITRPFNVDDYVEVAGYAGSVEDILLCNTKLRTPDNKVIYIPNSVASTSCVVNYSLKDLRRVDLKFSVSYKTDIEKARKIILEVLQAEDLILKDKEMTVRLSEQGQSALIFTCRSWVKNADYWTVYFNLNENVKKAFDKEGIEIPYNQLDVHVKNS